MMVFPAAAPADALVFVVDGKSATKGSVRSVVSDDGTVITKADNKRLHAWSEAVAWSARAAKVKRVPRPGAVGVSLLLVFERRKKTPLTETRMTFAPDVDKCLRAALDALTGIAYDDDEQVVESHQRKIFGPRAMVVFRVWEIRS